MDQLPVEIKINDYLNPQLHTLVDFLARYLANPAFYYIYAIFKLKFFIKISFIQNTVFYRFSNKNKG